MTPGERRPGALPPRAGRRGRGALSQSPSPPPVLPPPSPAPAGRGWYGPARPGGSARPPARRGRATVIPRRAAPARSSVPAPRAPTHPPALRPSGPQPQPQGRRPMSLGESHGEPGVRTGWGPAGVGPGPTIPPISGQKQSGKPPAAPGPRAGAGGRPGLYLRLLECGMGRSAASSCPHPRPSDSRGGGGPGMAVRSLWSLAGRFVSGGGAGPWLRVTRRLRGPGPSWPIQGESQGKSSRRPAGGARVCASGRWGGRGGDRGTRDRPCLP